MSLFRKNGYQPTEAPVNPLPPKSKPIYQPQPKEVVVKIKDEPYWHTGEPTEEGWYLKWTRNNEYTVSDLECTKGGWDIGYVIAWHKIPTYQG